MNTIGVPGRPVLDSGIGRADRCGPTGENRTERVELALLAADCCSPLSTRNCKKNVNDSTAIITNAAPNELQTRAERRKRPALSRGPLS